MGAPVGGCGGPWGAVGVSVALIAPEEPRALLRKTPRACLRAKIVDPV